MSKTTPPPPKDFDNRSLTQIGLYCLHCLFPFWVASSLAGTAIETDSLTCPRCQKPGQGLLFHLHIDKIEFPTSNHAVARRCDTALGIRKPR